MKIIFALLCFSLIAFSQSVIIYNVSAYKYSADPIISYSQGSAWNYTYNSAAYVQDDIVKLLVRCQNLKNDSVPFIVGASELSPSTIQFDSNGGSPTAPQAETLAYPLDPVTEACGTEDPRIAYYDGQYHLFYTAYNCTNAMLSSASSPNPSDPNSWTRNGYVFPEKNWSKSAAALYATDENKLDQHYLFWGDSFSPNNGIGIATSQDGVTWTDSGDLLIQIREDHFDSSLVESGPAPLQLSSGDFLFIYNSAQHGYPSVKPDWDLQYNLGYVILNGSNPLDVLQRSASPIMSPEYDWETGNSTEYLTPFVVFLEGLVPDPNGCPANLADYVTVDPTIQHDCFFGVYGGADSDLGAVRIIVSYIQLNDDGTIYNPNNVDEVQV